MQFKLAESTMINKKICRKKVKISSKFLDSGLVQFKLYFYLKSNFN
jgi:hypothetical protein